MPPEDAVLPEYTPASEYTPAPETRSRPPGGPRNIRWARVAVAVAVGLGAVYGWRLFWFLTDDAFIAFRYASNSMHGWGWVWNPPPFAPVEGYTSFLWVALLEGIWRLTGFEPPATANAVSLAFGLATLALGFKLAERMSLPRALEPWRLPLAALVLAAVLTNRTFLAWLSSGLETSMFNFLLTWWLWHALRTPAEQGRRWLLGLSAATACLALTRPDGLLFAAAAAALGFLAWLHGRLRPRDLLFALPLAAVPAHLVARRAFYGAWLPNTYYAKHLGPWPESGLRYLASFLVEYSFWIWLLLAAAWLVAAVRRRGRTVLRRAIERYPAVLALGALAAHFAYYTFSIGGDHFEYRVYSHLVLLGFCSGAWMVAQLLRRPGPVFAVLALWTVLSWPIPWAHWLATHELDSRKQTFRLTQPVAPILPGWCAPLVEPWDRWQAWLIRRGVCMRHQEHKIFAETQLRTWPPRELGERLFRWEDRPILVWDTVGVPGWVLPEVAIVDALGLNDRVIARVNVDLVADRGMAHQKRPPAGYVECFRPNLVRLPGTPPFERKPWKLTDEEIRRCEDHSW